MSVNFDNIPDELRARPQWVLWRWEQRADRTTGESKWTKPPYQPDGISAESDNRIPGLALKRRRQPMSVAALVASATCLQWTPKQRTGTQPWWTTASPGWTLTTWLTQRQGRFNLGRNQS